MQSSMYEAFCIILFVYAKHHGSGDICQLRYVLEVTMYIFLWFRTSVLHLLYTVLWTQICNKSGSKKPVSVLTSLREIIVLQIRIFVIQCSPIFTLSKIYK